MTAQPRAAARIFVYVFIFLDSLSFGIMLPVFPKLVESFTDGDTGEAALIMGLFTTVWAFLQFAFSPMVGLLSDRFGRRPLLLISTVGLSLNYALTALATSLAWLFVARVISGITAASFTTAGAYIADITPPERRAAAWGKVGAAWGLGFIIGPGVGGVLGGVDLRLPFWIAMGMALAATAFGWSVMPESLPPEKRAQFSWLKANPFGSLTLIKRHRELGGLSAVNVLVQTANHSLPAIFVFYAGYRYQWDSTWVGYALTVVGICVIVIQGGLAKVLVKWIGERATMMTGLSVGALGFFGIASAPTGALLFAALPFLQAMSLFGPTSFAQMTRLVEPHEQGQLQGAQNAIMGLTGLFAPAMFSWVFSMGIADGANLPGGAFALAGALLALAVPLGAVVTQTRRP
ncbi:MAG: TCR/Tet family MFS transporter [Alphaproteobacteria bacterium]|nr:TCR/Tet family MFS transporter [Alphaproteobacteria bacterium]